MMRNKRGVVFMFLGVCLLAAAIGLTVSNRLEEQRGERAAAMAEEILTRDVIPVFPVSAEGQEQYQEQGQENGYDTTSTQIQTVEIDKEEYMGVLTLPSLDLTLPVHYQWNNELLKQAPCRYSGSYLDDTMIIAGHNYRRHFSKIKGMGQGDAVSFTDINGTVYRYVVDDLEKIPGTDMRGMEAGEWDLTLFTCSYGGQDRIAVRCIREK